MFTWFLVMTLCTAGGNACNDYVVDGGLSFRDCQTQALTVKDRADMFSLRCDKGEIKGGNHEN